MKKYKKHGAKKAAAKRETRRMTVAEFVDRFVEGMLREDEAGQFDQRLTPEDKREMKAMGVARVAADDNETLVDTTRSEQAEAGVKTEEWKPGRPVRVWKLGRWRSIRAQSPLTG